MTPRGKYLETYRVDISLKPDDVGISEEDYSVHRCHSSLSQHSMISTKTPTETLGKALRAFLSQPL